MPGRPPVGTIAPSGTPRMAMDHERPTDQLLMVSGLHAGYGKIEILHGLSFGVERGQVVALLGTNGSGKDDHAADDRRAPPTARGKHLL